MDESVAVVMIGICVAVFLLILLGIGSFYGGDWETVAQGVTQFILLIVAFAVGSFVIVKLMGGK